jgi:cytochrome P450
MTGVLVDKAFDFDVFDRAIFEDPYRSYERLRDDYPIYHNRERDYWTVARYEDVKAVTRDWQTFTYARGVDIDSTGELLGPGNFLNTDPPTHTRLRNTVKREFVPKHIVSRVGEQLDAEVARLVGDWSRGDRVDLAGQLAWRLFPVINCLFLGLPREDADSLGELATRISERTVGDARLPADAQQAAGEFLDYLADQLRRCPRDEDSVLSIVAGAVEPDEGAGLLLLLFLGGAENVAGLITLCLWHLGRHPEQRQLLVDEPELIPAAVEELLRFDAPQQSFRRIATRPTELCGTAIPAGAPVILLYGSANRDPRVFQQPDTLDFGRRGRHLAFGDGIHHCLGAPLARLEAIAVLRAMMARFPEYEIATDEMERLANHATRAFVRQPATLG